MRSKQMVGSKMLVSAKDLPEIETASPLEMAQEMIESAELDEKEQALMEEILEPENNEDETPTTGAPAELTEESTGQTEKSTEQAGDPTDTAGSPSLFTLRQGMYLWFNFQELCLMLVSTNPIRSSYAIANLCFTYFDDMPSGFTRGSFLFKHSSSVDRAVEMNYFGPSIRNSFNQEMIYENARKAVYGDDVPGYEEIGDTAFITFDQFSADRTDYYDQQIDRNDPQDTIDLIIYANSQIKRKDSPVKNIVLDRSNNGGGDSDAAIFVISWFLGEADIARRDTFTGAETNAIYLADVNLDGKFDDQDNLVLNN